MEEIFAKLSQYKAYKKNPSSNNEANLKGQIYELYCYNYLINDINDVIIVKSNCVTKEKIGNFSYNKLGKINYHSNNIHLAEFDILGLKNKNIYFWEITKSEQGKKILRNEIERKRELLSKIFPNKNIVFTLILPRTITGFENYDIKIIKEPCYDDLLSNEYVKLNTKINNCINLLDFSQRAVEYNYINEVINYSNLYFNSVNKNALYDQHLIERIYDLNNIQNSKFNYYDIENKNYGEIIIKRNGIFKDKEKVKTIKKCFQEIRLIRKTIKTN